MRNVAVLIATPPRSTLLNRLQRFAAMLFAANELSNKIDARFAGSQATPDADIRQELCDIAALLED